jgi:phosphoserine phosphatase
VGPDSASGALLIHITGQDRSGVTHALTRILAKHQLRVLDIGQAVIHDALALGILIEWTEAARSSPLLSDVLLEAHKLNLQVRFTAVTADEYQTWVTAQGKQRFIVTVLGPEITSADLARISGILAAHRLNIERIDRLSARVPLLADEDSAAQRTCVEFMVSAPWAAMPFVETEVRAELAQLTQEFDIDIAFQQDDVYRRNRRLVAFDMDSTLIQAEVIDELAKEAGVGAKVAAITEAAMRGELDFRESFKRRVALLAGLPESALARVTERVPLMDGAGRLVGTLKKLGYKTAILSGGFTFFGRQLQERLGIDYLHANELEIENGMVTGRVAGDIVDGAAKARFLREIAEKEGLRLEQVIAVGDGANDLPMLRLAGLGIAFRAKPLVRQNARQAISTLGLDGILYLIGVRDREAG